MRLKQFRYLLFRLALLCSQLSAVFLLHSLGFTVHRGSQPILTEAVWHCLILWVRESISDSSVTCWKSPSNLLSESRQQEVCTWLNSVSFSRGVWGRDAFCVLGKARRHRKGVSNCNCKCGGCVPKCRLLGLACACVSLWSFLACISFLQNPGAWKLWHPPAVPHLLWLSSCRLLFLALQCTDPVRWPCKDRPVLVGWCRNPFTFASSLMCSVRPPHAHFCIVLALSFLYWQLKLKC